MNNRIEIGFETAKIAFQKLNPIRAVKDAIGEARMASFDRHVDHVVKESFEKLPPDSQLKISSLFQEFATRNAAEVHRELAQGHIEEASALEEKATQLGDELASHGWTKLTR